MVIGEEGFIILHKCNLCKRFYEPEDPEMRYLPVIGDKIGGSPLFFCLSCIKKLYDFEIRLIGFEPKGKCCDIPNNEYEWKLLKSIEEER
jgi:hypothetical protein